jgi:hypothetical protein
MSDIDFELIPKLKIASLNREYGIINRASDHGNHFEILNYVGVKLVLG